MRNYLLPGLFAIVMLVVAGNSHAATVVESFEIEGLISPASPKALASALEKALPVKVVGLNLKDTPSGWPVLKVQFDSGVVTKTKIESIIAVTEDPAGHKYRVHKGPPNANAPLLDEEQKAIAVLGPVPDKIPARTNPIPTSPESVGRGKTTFAQYCAKCHGLQGNGRGPAAHGITTFPRELWVWNNTEASTDGYLFWFITNGRTDMPPWGIILSENERWDVINYIKTLEAPKSN